MVIDSFTAGKIVRLRANLKKEKASRIATDQILILFHSLEGIVVEEKCQNPICDAVRKSSVGCPDCKSKGTITRYQNQTHRTKIRLRWTCSDYVHHEHKYKLSAWLCGRMQKLIKYIREREYSK